jgi:C1A family cysteine protease
MNYQGGNPTTISLIISTIILSCLILTNFSSINVDAEDPISYYIKEEIPPVISRSLSDLCGLVEPENWWENAKFDPCLPQRTLPTAYDWREYGGDPPIKDQGSCGGCWAFATTGVLECNIKIKHNQSVDLSEQWLMNCNQDGWDCDGGWFAHDYHMWKTDLCGDTGAVLEQYVPYSALNGSCNCPYPHDYFISSWSYIGNDNTIPSINSIKQAILDYGPISVAIRTNSAFQQYTGGVFNSHSPFAVNHAVVLVGWNDTQGANGVWILRNSWGPEWGEDGYMRIEYGCSSVGYASCYINYSPAVIEFNLPNGIPEVFTPGIQANFTVEIIEIGDILISASPSLHYRYNDGIYQTAPLLPISGNYFKAIFPPAQCNDVPEYYISAEGMSSGIHTFPLNAPNQTFTSFVGLLSKLYLDDFENDTGWIVNNSILLTDGEWDRGIPIGDGNRGDPPTDFDGSGKCFLTDNIDGNSDVDGGTTYLISPKMNLSDGSLAVINYAIWYTNYFGINPHEDYIKVYLSNDNGVNYQLVQSIGPYSVAAWVPYRIVVNDHMIPSDTMRIVFAASDLGLSSIVEAGIDAVYAYTLNCQNFFQISNLTSGWNMISLQYNISSIKNMIIVENNSILYSWDDAVQKNIVLDFIYGWNRTTQTSVSTNDLHPGYGYWSYSYYPCKYFYPINENIIYDSYITSANKYWNLINTPNNFFVNKTNLSISYNDQLYSWDTAVDSGIILPFLYAWDSISQSYTLTNWFVPGKGSWLYAYFPCELFHIPV